MKKIVIILIVCFGHNIIIAQSYKKIVHGNNQFSLELFKEIFDIDKNSFLSPYSISSALAMTYAGARENTEKQMADVLHFDKVQIKTHEGFKSLNEHLNNYDSDSSSTLMIANALWNRCNIKDNFLHITKMYYQAPVYPLENADKINSWVKEKTNNKIPEIVTQGDVINAMLILTNAIYFKGNWQKSFNKKNTKQDDFEGKEVQMMFQHNFFMYYEDNDVQVIELPYKENTISMIVMLPKPEYDIVYLAEDLDYDTYQYYLNSLYNQEVKLYLPKFKIETEYTLNNVLSEMGMTDAFKQASANFSEMCEENLYISKVFHKAFIDVNEEGTEAAAVTAVFMTTSIKPPPKIFKANRPFIFILKDNESNSILFIGAFNNPLKMN